MYQFWLALFQSKNWFKILLQLRCFTEKAVIANKLYNSLNHLTFINYFFCSLNLWSINKTRNIYIYIETGGLGQASDDEQQRTHNYAGTAKDNLGYTYPTAGML